MAEKRIISNIEAEKFAIAALLRFPALLADVSHRLSDNDFTSLVYKTIYSTIKVLAAENVDISPFTVYHRINTIGIFLEDFAGDSLLHFLEDHKNMQINEEGGLHFVKEVCKTTLRREIGQTARNIYKAVEGAADLSAEQIIEMADKIYSGKMSLFVREGGSEFYDIFENIERVIEERGNNPITEFGYHGPFEKMNYLYGAIYSPSDINIIASRANAGKSSYSFFNNVHIGDKYQVPILHGDSGEMTNYQLMIRAVCSLTKGKVPTSLLERGTWRKNPELVKLVREVWPRVKRLKVYYRNIGGMSSEEICSTIRRFYYSHVGRFADRIPSFGNPLGPCFPFNYDYLKPVEGGNETEWIEFGRHMQNMKNLITTEVPAAILTYLQLNRSGITRGKSAGQVDDSENAFSSSDRIYHQGSNCYILRYKTMDELAAENQKFGNMMLKNVKRRYLGEGYKEALNPVKGKDGSLKENYINLNQDSFYWEEHGSYSDMVNKIGVIRTGDNEEEDSLPDFNK